MRRRASIVSRPRARRRGSSRASEDPSCRISPDGTARQTRGRARRPTRTRTPCVVVAAVAVADRRRERMREIGGRVRLGTPSSSRDGASVRVERVPADVRHFHVAGRAEAAAGETGRVPAAPAPRRCLRTATAGRDRCRAAARRRRARPADRRAPRVVERGRRREVTDAGNDDGAARRRAPSSVSTMRTSAPTAASALLDRREIAGAVVDERDGHSSPSSIGSMRARRRSVAHATRSARANALKMASI